MILLAASLLLLLNAGIAGSMPGGPGIPENVTITFLNPTTVKVSWAIAATSVDKYDVRVKPINASYRLVEEVAGNSDAVTLSNLKADTQYQVTVVAVWRGKRYRSNPIVFRTLECETEPPRSSPQQDLMATLPTEGASTGAPLEQPEYTYPQTSSTVRGVEIGIVLLVLLVWVAAIALFFNRWGKIRMLLPYQPDYKQEQLKVPGTAACAAAVASGNTCTHHSGDHLCQQCDVAEEAETASFPINDNGDIHAGTSVGQSKKHRPRLNSAIFVSNSGPGLDPKEFFRRHGSVSRLCRKARSVDNISLEDGQGHDYERCHFGLPTLSISGPSPPENGNVEDDDSSEDARDEPKETERFLA